MDLQTHPPSLAAGDLPVDSLGADSPSWLSGQLTEMVVESLGLDVQAVQEQRNDLSFDESAYARNPDHQITINTDHCAIDRLGQDEVTCAVQPTRVEFGLEVECA